MADGRLRVLGVAPGGAALRKALAKSVKDGALVTGWDDGRLRTVAACLGPDTNADTVPFGDVLGRFIGMCGQPVRRIPTGGVQRATVEAALAELRGDGPLVGGERFPGTVRVVSDVLRELRHAGFDAGTMREHVARASGRLAPKLQNLADVMAMVEESFAAANLETAAERAERWAMPGCGARPPLPPLVVLADDEPHGVYEDWVRRVSAAGVSVTVLVESLPGRADLFSHAHRLARRLDTKLKPAAPRAWASSLFTKEPVAGGPAPTILATADPLAEAEWVLRGCLARMSEGVSPLRIAVFARDAETYGPLLDSSAQRLGVPTAMPRRAPLLTNGFARLLLEILRTLGGPDVRKLAVLGRSSYLSEGAAPRDELGPVLGAAYRARGRQWERVEDWASGNPEKFPWLTMLLRWREAAVSSSTGLAGWCGRLRQLGGLEGLLDLALADDRPTAAADKNAWTRLQAALSEHAQGLSDPGADLSLGGFAERAASIWDEETYFAGSAGRGVQIVHQTSALGDYDTLYAVGLLEGTLPRRRSEDPVLEDRDRQELAALSPQLTPLKTSFDRARGERDEFVRLVSAAEERLILSYPETGEDRDNVPAFYLEEIRRGFGVRVQEADRPRSVTVPPLEECVTPADLALRKALDGPRSVVELPELVSEWAQTIVRPNIGQGVSPEELVAVTECPFRAAARFRLPLRPPTRSTGLGPLLGIPASALLAGQPDRASALRALRLKANEVLDELYAELDPWESGLLENAAARLIEAWVEREFASRELWPREGQGFRTQVPLDQEGLRNDPKIPGRSVRLRGTVPAVSLIDGYSVVHMFESRAPGSPNQRAADVEEQDVFRYGLYLMLQARRGPEGLAVLVDSLDGQRTMLFVHGGQGRAPSRRFDRNLHTRQVADRSERGDFFQRLIERVSAAVDVLEEARMRPRPGAVCDTCPYGELCRVSREFGEPLSPFDAVPEARP